jgi:type II secretory ATPase GspE/PulE/Tfp pilus assembly ATPase PilB-like protein
VVAKSSQSFPGAAHDAARPGAQGRAEVLLDDRSLIRGFLRPFHEDDVFVEVAMDGDDGLSAPMRLRRDSLRAIKLDGWPNASIAESLPRPFRFEFDDAEVLAGDCVAVQPGSTGTWLRVVRPGGLKEHWFIDRRHCVRATLDNRPFSAQSPPPRHAQPACPDSLEALWSLLCTGQSAMDGALPLPEALLRAGWIDAAALRRAVDLQQRTRSPAPLEHFLVASGAIPEAQLRMARAEWMGARVIDPQALAPDRAALALLPRAHAERALALPLLLRDEELVVLVDDPMDKAVLDELRFVTQRRIVPVMAVPETLMPAIRRAYGAGPDPAETRDGQGGDVRSMADALMAAPEGADDRYSTIVAEADSALVRLINSMIAEAIVRRASDIHIETTEAPRHVRIRLRIDGEMLPFVELPSRLRFAIVARLKIMAELDISEHRRPQDGKIDFARFGGSHVELRVVTVPTSRGLEDVVLRLLSGLKPRPLDDIDLSAGNLAGLRVAALKPYGLILICGPTGCGKTTTLHSVMRELNTGTRKIWTAEDPIEITQEGLRQVQINPHIGWTFAAAMRTFLRADPDVIMIGEMRDEETARIAIDASLTGHLVLSTLHTNSAPESIARLLEIGLDPFNFSDSLLAILAQRLVRRLCTSCREPVTMDAEELETMSGLYLGAAADAAQRAALKDAWCRGHADAHGNVRLFRRRGCAKCDGHGYSGRLAIHELMVADDTIRAHVRHRESAPVLQADALAAGMKTLRQDGIDKVLEGLTDLSEVLSATQA